MGLEAVECGTGRNELGTGAEDDAIRLRIAAIARIAGGVKEACAVAIVQDCSPAIVSTVCIGLGEGELAFAIDGGYGAVDVPTAGVGGGR